MILVTGATGHFGKAAIQYLLKNGTAAKDISALVRDENKAVDLKQLGINLIKADYDDKASLIKAFAGIDKLLFVSGSDIAKRGLQQQNVVAAAIAAGVSYILYTSFERGVEDGTSAVAFVADAHLATEKAIKESGINYTIFRNNLYTDFIPMFIGDKVLETGIYWPSGEGKLAAAVREEMAEAAANVLTTTGHDGKEYFISGEENVSFSDVAKYISKASGKEVLFVSPTQEEYIAALTNAGVPTEYINMFAGFAEGIKQGEFETTQHDLSKLLGRKATSVETFLTNQYAS
ncbi:MAG: SDR family oxidoreductase [Sphingobacteriales bacterium]|nr:MAG: SDR family oxidoreductase [Sphingobacteriales bacterium]